MVGDRHARPSRWPDTRSTTKAGGATRCSCPDWSIEPRPTTFPNQRHPGHFPLRILTFIQLRVGKGFNLSLFQPDFAAMRPISMSASRARETFEASAVPLRYLGKGIPPYHGFVGGALLAVAVVMLPLSPGKAGDLPSW